MEPNKSQKIISLPGGIISTISSGLMLFGMIVLGIVLLAIDEGVAKGEYYIVDHALYIRSIIGEVLYMAGGVIGLIGGIKALKSNATAGGVMSFIAAVCALAVGILAVAPLGYVCAVMFVIGGILCFVVKKPMAPKPAQSPYGNGYQQPPYGNGYQQPPYGNGYQQPPYGNGYQQPPYGNGYQQPPASNGMRYDPQTGAPVYPNNMKYDPLTGKPVYPGNVKYDPQTGAPYYAPEQSGSDSHADEAAPEEPAGEEKKDD